MAKKILTLIKLQIPGGQANPAPPDQHPYAGWLYMQFLLGTIQNRDDGFFPRYADLYELEIGMVGPSAMGRQAQRGIHQILGAPDPQGWDSQLEDEFAFAVSYERRWSSLRYFTDMVPGGLEGVLGRVLAASFTAIADGSWRRLKACRNHGCRWAFYDYSKNRSASWCSMQLCGNRTKTRAYRARRARPATRA